MKLDRLLEVTIATIVIALLIGVLFAVCIPFYMLAETAKENSQQYQDAKANGYEAFPTADKHAKLHKELADNMTANLQTLANASQ